MFKLYYLVFFYNTSCCLQIDVLEYEEALVDPHDVVVDLGQIALHSVVGDLRLGSKHDRGRS